AHAGGVGAVAGEGDAGELERRVGGVFVARPRADEAAVLRVGGGAPAHALAAGKGRREAEHAQGDEGGSDDGAQLPLEHVCLLRWLSRRARRAAETGAGPAEEAKPAPVPAEGCFRRDATEECMIRFSR